MEILQISCWCSEFFSINLCMRFDNKKYYHKLPHFQVMTKRMKKTYFLVIKSIYSVFTC